MATEAPKLGLGDYVVLFLFGLFLLSIIVVPISLIGGIGLGLFIATFVLAHVIPVLIIFW